MSRTCLIAVAIWLSGPGVRAADPVRVEQGDGYIQIDTDQLQARVATKGYVSGIARGSLLDKTTGAREVGFGLHIMDFLLAPGWRDDGYERNPLLHGRLPKHYVEGPQICTKARELPAEVIRGDGFVAVKLRFTFTQPGQGYKAGSTWEQTLLFRPAVRYVLSSERITSANTVDDLFYRIDMPGHLRHKAGDTFTQIFLSYVDKPIPASEFRTDFAPDAKYLYQRKDEEIPKRMIRAYQVKVADKPGPWLAGITLDPAAVSEAWCHQRGYVCFIQELHRRPVKAGESFGAAYAVGWFDDVAAMEKAADEFRGIGRIILDNGKYKLSTAQDGRE